LRDDDNDDNKSFLNIENFLIYNIFAIEYVENKYEYFPSLFDTSKENDKMHDIFAKYSNIS